MNEPEKKMVGVIRYVTKSGKLIYTTTAGGYLGTIEYDAPTTEAARVIAEDFAKFIRESTSGIAVAGGPLPPQRPTS